MDVTPNARYEGGNRVIDGLPAAERREAIRHLTMMTAEEASGGIARGEPIAAVYFPIDAVFSVLVELSGGDCYEVDTIGRGGLIGGELLFGAEGASRSVICQVSGRFAQMPRDAFEQHLAQVPSFATAVQNAMLLQSYRAQQTIACNFAHTLVERCARWILLTHDAIGRADFTFRSEYLAMMLGVQTNVVAEPLAALQALGTVRFADEVVTVVSERRLRDAACECYTVPVEYAQRLETRPRMQRDAHKTE
ncbi:MAG TPA: Crp/Fnr family transcriptional regulator [Candidatus Elarobacter sp.]|nr:Crp/Fnr family transcriptional regulator [Candidatus Elarobacter sp.]